MFFITNRCNASCAHCFYWDRIEEARRNELTLEEIEKLTSGIGHLPYLLLSGGEPFLRKDILQICDLFARNAGTAFITIPTNAILSKQVAAFAEDLVSAHPRLSLRIQLSLDAVGKSHDEFRGYEGNFDRLMDTHDRLVQVRERHGNLSIGVVTVLCRKNYEGFEGIIHHVNQNMSVNQHHIGYLRPQGRGDQETAVSADEFRRAQEMLHSFGVKEDNRPLWKLLRAANRQDSEILARTIETDEMQLPCKAVNKFAVMDEVGDVYPCEILSELLGNVRQHEYSIPAILEAKRARDLQHWIVESKCFCTWECAIHNNVLFTPSNYPSLAADWARIALSNTAE